MFKGRTWIELCVCFTYCYLLSVCISIVNSLTAYKFNLLTASCLDEWFYNMTHMTNESMMSGRYMIIIDHMTSMNRLKLNMETHNQLNEQAFM